MTSLPLRRPGFSLLELVVVMALVSVLAGAIAPSLGERLARARDARRLVDVQAVREALEEYKLVHGTYPVGQESAAYGGWDVSHDGGFLPELQREGFLTSAVADPKNDETHHYRFHRYAAGTYGCAAGDDFYVLGIRTWETDTYRTQHRGFFSCSGRNWSDEFDWVAAGLTQ